MTIQATSTFRQKPATRLGWWAAGLAAIYVLMILITAVGTMIGSQSTDQRNAVPNSGFAMLLIGLASGVVALIAILRNRERSWMVLAALIPGVLGVLLILGEFLLPH